MKNIIKSNLIYFILCATLITGLASCKKENDKAAPVITRVRTATRNDTVTLITRNTLTSSDTVRTTKIVAFDSTTTVGKLSTQYVIIGQHLATTSAVYFNGTAVYFNPALVTDNLIIVTIPTTVPYVGSNVLKVVTKYGTVETPFSILQPPPAITTISQLAGNAGDSIVITGTAFDGLSSAKFGTTDATIKSKSSTRAVVIVPAGLSGANLISLTTTASAGGGTGTGLSVSAGSNYNGAAQTSIVPFGFSVTGYEDALENGWSDYGWSNNFTNNSTEQVKRGTNAIKVQYGGGYDGFVLQTGTSVSAITAKSTIKMALYGGKGSNGKNIHVLINDDFNHFVTVTLVEGAWTEFNIPISTWVYNGANTPTALTDIIFQEFSGNATLFYMDDVGVVQ